jgi:arylsulfatase A-like enzyme
MTANLFRTMALAWAQGEGPLRAVRVATSAALLAAAAPFATAAAPAPAPKQPNIVFVLVDDLRFDSMGFLTPGLKTPNIDFLARNGTYFPNAVVTSALCSPSRATILTGQTARNHGVIDNNNSTEKGLTFFPTYLQSAGYQTAFVGKWHMGDATDAPRPGFDHWVSFRGQGSYFPTDGLTPQQIAAGQKHMLNVDGRPVEQKGYITDELTDYAMQWLERGRDRDKPFFLYLSHKAVHSDAKPPARYADQYADLDIKLPASMANTEENNRGKPMWVRNQRNSWHGADFIYHTNQPLSEYVRQYYRTLSPVDDSLGRILGYLRKHELENNTLVVFYSDNGFLFGDHGLIDKRNAYEPSVRVPMVAYAPGLLPKGAVNTARVRNLDLAPTFLDAARVTPPAHFEGKSILPIATGKAPAETWAEDFVYEYYWEWTFPHTPTTFAIQRGNLKYIQYHGVWDIEELYDLAQDPNEMNNRSNDPTLLSAKVELRHQLHAALANRDGKHVVPYTERFSSGVVDRAKDGPGAAPFPPEWLKAPNHPGRMHGLFPDTPEKLEAEKAGRPYWPSRPVGAGARKSE